MKDLTTRYNSSKYRVKPMMDYFGAHPEKILRFLRTVGICVDTLPCAVFYDSDGEGICEKPLKPTKAHLLALADHFGKKEFRTSETVNKDRQLLFHGTAVQRAEKAAEARRLIEENYESLRPSDRKWYIFEGFTHPDVYIEGEDYVIVCEGKWTEPHITTETANLTAADGESRCQMLRHIQAALNSTDKPVYGFYIVDENCGYLPDLTRKALDAQTEKETVPLSDADKRKIKDAFYGFTTWQTISALFPDIPFPSKDAIDLRNRG